jgi:hypothetical protein
LSGLNFGGQVKEAERERIFDGLAIELQKVDPNLAFEFGPNDPKREFVISAAGIRSAFPAFVSLAAAAPTLEKWKVIAFRPPAAPDCREVPGQVCRLQGGSVLFAR